MAKLKKITPTQIAALPGYDDFVSGLVQILDSARSTAARAVNAVMTSTYWEIGHRIVTFEQGGEERAAYGEALLQKIAKDLSSRSGRGFFC